LVGLGASLFFERKVRTKVKFAALASLPGFGIPTITVQENGTYGGRRQSRWLHTADGFAVCGFTATPAKYFDPSKKPASAWE